MEFSLELHPFSNTRPFQEEAVKKQKIMVEIWWEEAGNLVGGVVNLVGGGREEECSIILLLRILDKFLDLLDLRFLNHKEG